MTLKLRPPRIHRDSRGRYQHLPKNLWIFGLFGTLLLYGYILERKEAEIEALERQIEAIETTLPTPQPKESQPEGDRAEADRTLELVGRGGVSYYDHEGCLGCNEERRMGNGQILDEAAYTIAIPCEWVLDPQEKHTRQVRYGHTLFVRNDTTSKAVEVTVTDCGGFSKYGRVADVTPAVMDALELATDDTISLWREEGK